MTAAGPRLRKRAWSIVTLAAAVALGPVATPTLVSAQAGSRATEARPFRHSVHLRTIACGDCHRPEQRHRGAEWSAPRCAACHHGDAVVEGCTTCHARAELAGSRARPTPMALSVWPDSRVRELPFDHALHGDLGCLDCHREGMSRPAADCAGCHADHHRAEAECTRCHAPAANEAHDLAVHGGCAGAGCHQREGTPAPAATRSSCLLCHREQREHRPAGVCTECHALPRNPTPTTEH